MLIVSLFGHGRGLRACLLPALTRFRPLRWLYYSTTRRVWTSAAFWAPSIVPLLFGPESATCLARARRRNISLLHSLTLFPRIFGIGFLAFEFQFTAWEVQLKLLMPLAPSHFRLKSRWDLEVPLNFWVDIWIRPYWVKEEGRAARWISFPLMKRSSIHPNHLS